MKEDEKFEKFAKALREYVKEVNKKSVAEGNGKMIYFKKTEELIDALEFYLENQEKIKKSLQEALDAYRKLNYTKASFDEWAKIDMEYYTRYFYDEVVEEIDTVGIHSGDSICYNYDGSVLTFGIWELEYFRELVRIAINTRLLFKDEEELKDLVRDVADALKFR